MPNYYFWENGIVGPVNFEPGVTESVNQTGHGFELPPYGFIPVYDNSGTWTKAIASASSTYHEALIIEITDSDNFVIQRRGYVNIASHGLAVARDYYLSDDDAGEIQAIPTTNLVKCITPVNENYVFIYNVSYPAVINGLSIDSTTGQIKLGGALTENTTISSVTENFTLVCDLLSIASVSGTNFASSGAITISSNSANTVTLRSLGGDVDVAAGADLNLDGTTGVNVDTSGNALTIREAVLGAGGASVGDVLTLKNTTTGECEWDAATGSSPLTTKGDIYAYDTGDARLPVGTNGQYLVADSTQSLGIKWGNLTTGDLSCATFYDNTGGQTLTTTRTVINLDATMTNNDGTTYSLASDEVTIGTDGFYLITFAIAGGLATGTRDNYYGYVQVDTGGGYADIDGTFIGGYNRISGEYSSASGSFVYELSSGDKIRLSADCTAANAINTVADGSRLSFVLLSGAVGPQGPAGSVSPLTTKGDIFGFSTVDARLPVGTDGQVLTADSAQSLGIKWADASSFDPGTYTNASNAFSVSGTVRSRVDSANQIYLEGSIGLSGGKAANATLITITDSPAATSRFSGVWYDGTNYNPVAFRCDTSGNVSVDFAVTTSDDFFFDGCTFYAG